MMPFIPMSIICSLKMVLLPLVFHVDLKGCHQKHWEKSWMLEVKMFM